MWEGRWLRDRRGPREDGSLQYPVPEIDLDLPQSAVADTECMTKGLHPMLWTAGSSRLVAGLPRRVGLEGQESAIDFSAQWPAALPLSGRLTAAQGQKTT